MGLTAEQALQQAYALSKRFTEKTIVGEGAVKGKDGFSPVVSTKQVENGTEVSITDATHTETFVVKNGSGTSGGAEYSFQVIDGNLYYSLVESVTGE